jgi:YfiH family protein
LSDSDSGVWSIERGFARCVPLSVEGIAHGFGMRLHDVGPAGSTEREHARSRARLVKSVSCGAGPACLLRQVHGAEVVRGGSVEADGVAADGAYERVDCLRNRFLAVRTADCVPILLASRDGRFVAAVHAGWRGTARGIVGNAVRALADLGCPPATLIAAAGPSIGACCYPVSPQIAREVAAASGGSLASLTQGDRESPRLDLRAANRSQLRVAGLRAASIHLAPWCTFCEPDLFFSYRREGADTGRQLSLIGPVCGRP